MPRKHLGDSESTQQQLHPSLRSESRRRAWRSSWWGRPAQRPGHPCRRWSPLRVEARLGGAAGSRSSLEGLDPWTEIPPLEAMLRPQVPGAPPTRSSDPLGLWLPSHLCGRGSLHSCPPASSFTPSSGPCHPRSDLTRWDEAPLLLEAIRGGHSGFTPRAGAQGSRDRKRASLSGREGSAASPPVRCSRGCRQKRGRGGMGVEDWGATALGELRGRGCWPPLLRRLQVRPEPLTHGV